MNNDLYKEEILEHYKNPQNFGKLVKFDAHSKQVNPFCGDEIEIYVQFESKGVNKKSPEGCLYCRDKIQQIKFTGRGCAISIAAGSMITEFAKGKTKKELTTFKEKDMLNLLGIDVSATRKKCALLPLFVLKDCLYGKI